MNIRKTTAADVSEAADIYDRARAFMRENGNKDQWSVGGPDAEQICKDIDVGASYVVEDGGEIVGVFFFFVGDDPTYKSIYGGAWRSDKRYAVIHRVAVKYNGRGIAGTIFDYCYSRHAHLRIDTHKDNIPMQRSLAKNGFVACGTIYLANGDERIAYDKI